MLRFDVLVWIVPAVVGLLAIWRPRLAFVAFAAGLAFFGSPPGGPYLAALNVAVLALVALTIWRRPAPPAGELWPSIAFVLVSLASLVPLAYHLPSWSPRVLLGLIRVFPDVESWSALYTWRAAATMLLGWLLFIALRRHFEAGSVRQLGVGLAFGVGVVCVLGLLAQVQWVDLDGYRAIGEFVPAVRMHSLFFNSGWFAEFLVLSTPFAVSSLIAVRQKTLAFVLVGLAGACVVLSQQRGAWFAAVVILGWVGWREREALWRPGRTRTMLIVAAAVFCVGLGTVLIVGSPARRALAQRAEVATADLAGRTHLWHAALQMSVSRPLLGHGTGSFAPAYDRLHPPGSPDAHRPRGTAHSWLLDVLAERGLLGVLALLTFAAAIAIRLRGALGDGFGEARILALGLTASLLGAAVYGVVQYIPFLESMEWLLWLLAGAAYCLVPDATDGRRIRRLAQAVCLAALILMPIRALAFPSPHWRGDAEYGLHEPETSGGHSFQWTDRDAALRLPWRGECLELTLANGHPQPARFPMTVTLTVRDVRRAVRLVDGWTTIVLPVGTVRSSALTLGITASPAFRPFSEYRRHGLAPSSDVRRLGVAMRPPVWVDCTSETP